MIFILDDMDAAGYFYHDLMQVGSGKVLFFPSSYRRAVKYGQKDAANEVLRTEVLSCLQKGERITVVTYPEALAEQVVSLQEMDRKTLMLEVGQQIETDVVLRTLTDFGFERWIMCTSRVSLHFGEVFWIFFRSLRSFRTVWTFSERKLTVFVRLKWNHSFRKNAWSRLRWCRNCMPRIRML